MDYQSFKNAVIAKAEELGIAEYELYYQSGTSTSVDTFRHEINEFSASEEGDRKSTRLNSSHCL